MNSSEFTKHWSAFELRDPATTIEHQAFNEAMTKLKRIMATQDDTWLAQVVAPTGAGKTHAATVLHGEVLDKHAEEMKSDPTFMPSVYVSMSLLSDGMRHSWSDDHWKILHALKHPNPRSGNLSEAREKLNKALVARRTEQLILDEAAHFISGCNFNDIEAIKRRANVVKSLTEDTQTRLVLCATYDLLPMIRVDGQLARRNQVVHLKRYRNTADDRAQFTAVLRYLDQEYSDHLTVSLVKMDDAIYRGCLGLIGTLRNWLVRASTSAEQSGRRGIAKHDLEETKLSLGELTPMLEGALNGEESLADTLQDHANFEMLLKQDQTADRGNLPDDSDAADSGEDSSKDKEQDTQPPPLKSKKGRRCGRPNPKRIRTGPPEEESTGT